MPEHEAIPEDDRRTRQRRDGEPLRWQEIAQRREWDSLPFLHYFDEVNNPAPQQ